MLSARSKRLKGLHEISSSSAGTPERCEGRRGKLKLVGWISGVIYGGYINKLQCSSLMGKASLPPLVHASKWQEGHCRTIMNREIEN